MLKQVTRWLDPILLIGLFVSLSVGVGMVLTGNDTLSGLTIGLLSTIITLLIDIVARIQKAEDSFVNMAGLSQVLSDEAIGKALRDIADSYDATRKINFEHYGKIASATIDECRSKLHELASGSVTVQARTPQAYGVLGFQQASKDIKVIHIDSMDFWNKDFGRKYFDLNRATLKRGVQITRIFALTSEEARDYTDILKEHEKAGIRVFVVRPDRVDHAFMIFDNRVVVDLDVDVNNDFKLERVVIDPTQVKKKVEEFEHLITRYARTIKDAAHVA
ncbi:MAG TPA: hypothetical protein VJ793_22310 [Anaerolineae bacterium]|nr:hypothetical protein [Anaerolineae bacterium]